jgi:hypothetical protein
MTEQEWLECTDPKPMLEFLRALASDRKLRLFGVACCRRLWSLLADDRSRKAVEVAEMFVDGTVGVAEVTAAEHEAWESTSGQDWEKPGAKVCDWYGARLAAFVVSYSNLEPFNVAWAAGAAAATDGLGWEDPLWDRALYAAYTAVGYTVEDEEHWKEVRLSEAPFEMGYDSFNNFPLWHTERKAQVKDLRDLFGNLFQPRPTIEPAILEWNGGTVVKLATAIYDQRRFRDMPILADALEEAGCNNPYVLGHCRQPGHVKGCFVLDTVLGKK